MVTLELRLFADYHQIHLFDEGSQADVADAWTEEAVADNIAVAGDAIAVGTAVNGFVAVRVELLDQPPVPDTGDFDHVVEGSMQVRSGRLVVMGCTECEPEATRFDVPTGWLRMRASRSNLAVATRLGVESSEDPATTEQLRIQVWPAPQQPTVVVKRWQPDAG